MSKEDVVDQSSCCGEGEAFDSARCRGANETAVISERCGNNDVSVRQCCADFYELSSVHKILGEHFHPGGIELSRRLVDSLSLCSGSCVLDVACGIGASAVDIASRIGAHVIGLDYSISNIEKAQVTALKNADIGSRISFLQGDAHKLPFEPDSFDAIICECAVSTFTDKIGVLKEFARVLKPGGLVAISDMAIEGEIPDEIASYLTPWTCLSDARSRQGYKQLFSEAGFELISEQDESQSLLEMADDLKRRMLLMGIGDLAGILPQGLGDLATIHRALKQSQALVRDGVVEYWRLIFRRRQYS